MQEDVNFCDEGETTIARDGAIAIPGVFYSTDDGQEATVEEKCHTYCRKLDQPFDILGIGLSDRNSTQHRSLEVSLALRRGAGGREQRPRMMRSSIQQLKNAYKMRTVSRTRTLGSRVSRRESRTTPR